MSFIYPSTFLLITQGFYYGSDDGTKDTLWKLIYINCFHIKILICSVGACYFWKKNISNRACSVIPFVPVILSTIISFNRYPVGFLLW